MGQPREAWPPSTIPAYIAAVLRSLGYRVHLHIVPYPAITTAMWRRGIQIYAGGDWLATYPDPSSYIPQFFSCGGGDSNGWYCNPTLDREMQDAEQLDSQNRPRQEPSGSPSIANSPTTRSGYQPSPTQTSNSPLAAFATTSTTPSGASSPTKRGLR